ncbi:MAG: heparan-alpha-glucosaminide N-acetyltransferase domain-containing protein [Thermomonas sp.]|uniref:acyltransferase family protein n=1 Tax=Thermomonas sp. TaxID=1971895 RepID=UPI0039E39805
MNAPRRFSSVDVLRGWAVAAMLLVNYPGDWGHVYPLLLHAEWNGFTPTDLIFPTFLFVVGVSISLGLRPGAPLSKIWLRALRLVLVGLLLHALAMWAYGKADFRPWGVLQRIGLCYGVAVTLALTLRPRGQWAVIVAILLGYWALLAATGGYAPQVNIASRLDAWMLGAHAYQFDAATGLGHEPEGLLSTLPAIATTLIGVRAGAWLRTHGASRLLLAGLAVLAIGWLWSQAVPLNKNLWTSSYVLWAAGWSMLLLALCHWLFDVRGLRAFGRSMGINAITAYAGSWVMACLMERFGLFGALYRGVFLPSIGTRFGEEATSLAFAIAFVALWWLLMWGMEKKGWRVTI